MGETAANGCAIIRTQSKTSIGCWRSIRAIRLVLRISPEPGHPFCNTRLKKACCKCIYVSHCNTATAFSANSYCRYRQLGWPSFTSNFKFVATWFSLLCLVSLMTAMFEIHAQLCYYNIILCNVMYLLFCLFMYRYHNWTATCLSLPHSFVYDTTC